MKVERRPPGWAGVAIAGAAGLLLGVLLMVALGAASDPQTKTTTSVRRVYVKPPKGTKLVRTYEVPDVTGEPLDVARGHLEERGFEVKTEGGGILGIIFDSDWRVAEQDPEPGTYQERGERVTLHVER